MEDMLDNDDRSYIDDIMRRIRSTYRMVKVSYFGTWGDDGIPIIEAYNVPDELEQELLTFWYDLVSKGRYRQGWHSCLACLSINPDE